MSEVLICLSCDNTQALVFHGSVDLTTSREEVNDIKLDLLNRIHSSSSPTRNSFA